tara:strand:+ start:367 stop:1026 length:660 start_codon:yes stop_codon:yes gene_type:complete
MKSFKDIVEIKSQTSVFAFGRFNPPTAGHLKLAMKVKQVAGSDDGFIYTSHSQDSKKNPLDYRTKTKFMKLLFRPAKVTVSTSNSRTVFDVVVDLYDKGYRSIKMIAGSDRIKEFEGLLTKYNGVKGRHGFYNFKSIQVVSAGERDPDAEGIAGMSASKMRAMAFDGDEKGFISALPKTFRQGKQLYKAVRKGMALTEEFHHIPEYIRNDIGRDIRLTT